MTTARVSLFWGAFFFGSLFFLVFYFLNEHLPYILTDNEAVVALTSEALKVVAVMQAVDSVVNVASGVLKGAGKQAFGAVTNFIGYYIIGLPVGVALMMDFGAGMKVPGYWWGQVIGLSIQSLAYISYLTCKIDWDETAAVAKRVAGGSMGSTKVTENGDTQEIEESGAEDPAPTPRVVRRQCLSKKVIFVAVFLVAFVASLINSTIPYRIDLKYLAVNSTGDNVTGVDSWNVTSTTTNITDAFNVTEA